MLFQSFICAKSPTDTIQTEFNTLPLGAYEGYKIPTAIPLENNIPRACGGVIDSGCSDKQYHFICSLCDKDGTVLLSGLSAKTGWNVLSKQNERNELQIVDIKHLFYASKEEAFAFNVKDAVTAMKNEENADRETEWRKSMEHIEGCILS